MSVYTSQLISGVQYIAIEYNTIHEICMRWFSCNVPWPTNFYAVYYNALRVSVWSGCDKDNWEDTAWWWELEEDPSGNSSHEAAQSSSYCQALPGYVVWLWKALTVLETTSWRNCLTSDGFNSVEDY